MAPTRPGRFRTFVLVAAVGALTLSACGDDDVSVNADDGTNAALDSPPDSEATYSGEITTVSVFEPITEDCVDPSGLDPDQAVSSDDPPFCTDVATAPLGSILVEELPEEQSGDKISLRIDPTTPIFRDGADGPVEISFEDMAEGDAVDVWVSGPVADSYPQQGSPDAVLVRA